MEKFGPKIIIVLSFDGQWSLWTKGAYSYENEKKLRERKCNNPDPQNGGKHCLGYPELYVECEEGVWQSKTVKKSSLG